MAGPSTGRSGRTCFTRGVGGLQDPRVVAGRVGRGEELAQVGLVPDLDRGHVVAPALGGPGRGVGQIGGIGRRVLVHPAVPPGPRAALLDVLGRGRGPARRGPEGHDRPSGRGPARGRRRGRPSPRTSRAACPCPPARASTSRGRCGRCWRRPRPGGRARGRSRRRWRSSTAGGWPPRAAAACSRRRVPPTARHARATRLQRSGRATEGQGSRRSGGVRRPLDSPAVRNPRDFMKPLAIGAPEPVRDVPLTPSRMIHFFDPSNEKIVGKLPDLATKADVLLGNLEDAIAVENKEAAREGLVKVGKEMDLGDAALWTRVNDLASPWVLDDLTTLVTEIGDKLEVVMVPEGRGRLGHPLRGSPPRPARGPGGARAAHPRARDPRDRARCRQPRGDRRGVPADAGHELRPGRPGGVTADEDHPRGRRTPRLPGDLRPRSRRPGGGAAHRPAGPLALLDRPHGRRLRRHRRPALLRPLRRHQGPQGLRGAVSRRLPHGLRRRVVAAPRADRRGQEGLLARIRTR